MKTIPISFQNRINAVLRHYPLIFLFVCLNSLCTDACKNHPGISVPPEEDIQPGKRNYVWTIDTIKSEDMIWRLWGAEPNDIWASTVNNELYHFDGLIWKKLEYFSGPSLMFGFGKYDIWGASSSYIWHYNGLKWEKKYALSNSEFPNAFYNDLWGVTQNEIYLGGCSDFDSLNNYYGVILKYDGNSWKNFPISKVRGSIHSILKSGNDLLVCIQSDSIGLGEYFFVGKIINDRVEKLLTTSDYAKIFALQKDIYCMMEKKIYKYSTGRFSMVTDFSDQEYFYNILSGRTMKDVFCLMAAGSKRWLGHYNGSDIQWLKMLEGINPSFFCDLVFEKDYILSSRDLYAGYNIIYRGKLSE